MPSRRRKKSHRGIAKRFKVNKHGVMTSNKAGYHHKLNKRSAKPKRQARQGLRVEGQLRKNFLELLSS